MSFSTTAIGKTKSVAVAEIATFKTCISCSAKSVGSLKSSFSVLSTSLEGILA